MKDLREKAKVAGIKGYSQMSKQDLVEALARQFPVTAYGDCDARQFPVTAYGDCDARQLPPGFVHISGKRIQPTCKRLGIECRRALVDFDKVKGRSVPVHDGVVVRAEDADRLKAALTDRALKDTPEKRAKRKAARERRHERDLAKVAAKIRARYPNMPQGEELKIARRAWEPGSGRVGRSGSAEDPIGAAVTAHIRHNYTDYDSLLWELGGDDTAREMARDTVWEEVDRIRTSWEGEESAEAP